MVDELETGIPCGTEGNTIRATDRGTFDVLLLGVIGFLHFCNLHNRFNSLRKIKTHVWSSPGTGQTHAEMRLVHK